MKTPTITEVEINNEAYFRLTYWENGRRRRSHFRNLEDAEERKAQLEAEIEKHGEGWMDSPMRLRIEAVEARDLLLGSGLSIPDAVRLALAGQAKKTTNLADAVDEFIESRSYQGGQYFRSLPGILGKLVTFYPGRTLQSITTAEIDVFLDGVAGQTSIATRNHTRTVVGMMFERGVSLGYCTRNPVKMTRKIKTIPSPIQILTPAECRRLLEACDPAILPGVVLRLFCFIRGSEMNRLGWDAVTLIGEEPRVMLSAAITKTASARKVSIPPCALSWLPKKQGRGLVLPNSQYLRQLWDKSRLDAGFGPFIGYRGETPSGKLKPWPRNALRHTGISYLLASTQNLALVEYQAGNSASVIRRHYDGLATSKAAQVHFSTFRR